MSIWRAVLYSCAALLLFYLILYSFAWLMSKWADREERKLILATHGDLEVRRPSWQATAARQHNLRDEEVGALRPASTDRTADLRGDVRGR